MTSTLDKSVTEAVAAGQRAVALDTAMIAKITDLAGQFAVSATIAIIILLVTLFAAKWAAAGTRKALGRVRGFRHDPTVLSFAVQVVRTIVLLIGFIAVLGAASLAVGLALQGTLSNVAAGMMLLILRPYRVGDVVTIGGNTGSVQRLDLFVTQMADGNNVKIIVPNGKVFGDTILNLSGQKTRRMELKIGVGQGSNLSQTRDVLVAAAASIGPVLKTPAPWAGVTNLLDSSVEMTLQAWTLSPDYFQARADVFQAVKEALDKAKIEIPFPHQVSVTYDPNSEVAATDNGAKVKSVRKASPHQTTGDVQDTPSEG